MIKITEKQAEILEYITEFFEQEDRLPSSREIAHDFGFASQTAAMSHLNRLADKGYLERRSSITGNNSWRFPRNED